MTREEWIKQAYEAGVITLEQYRAEQKAHAAPPPRASVTDWHSTILWAAAHRRCGLRAWEVERLGRTFGSTQE